MNTLKIIRASAGSGKTFTLAVEYIKHLIINPLSYRNVLAVTFTNKATLEMKQRILSQLYGLSRGLEDSKAYMDSLMESLKDEKIETGGKPLEQIIRERCQIALCGIIHNYHAFRIQTIDAFFQSIVRELAHDLDLTANLRVDLDNKAALKEGVGKVIDSIVYNPETKERVFSYVISKMNDNKNWNISDEMQKFGMNIFNENFLENGEELRNKLEEPGFIKGVQKKLENAIKTSVYEANQKARNILKICEERGLHEENFHKKSTGIYGFLTKLESSTNLQASKGYITPAKYVKDCMESSDAWSRDSNVIGIVEMEHFVDMLKDTVKTLEESTFTIISANITLKNLNNLSLINNISNMVQAVTSERNDFLLSNTNDFLNRMIEGSDVPFIYERTGSRFDHIMIDEFQDTSGLQWKNFKPLIKNSLDSNNECLLVGDVKQSIYRWRNSEWSILNNLSHDPEFTENISDQPLKMNYRSCSKIVEFNNSFFENATNVLEDDFSNTINSPSDDIRIAYNECGQQCPTYRDENEGFVKIELMSPIPSTEAKETAETKVETNGDMNATSTSTTLSTENEWHCKRLEHNVKQLLSEGVSPNDICILIRANNSVKIITDYFDHNVRDDKGNPIKIISSQAYELSNSIAVSTIIYALRVIVSPKDRLSLSILTYHYQTNVMGSTVFTDDPNKVFLLSTEEQNSFLPPNFIQHINELEIVPLYELCERLYSIFGLDQLKGQDSYLFAYFDYLNEYIDDRMTDIDSFLTFWDETLSHKTINVRTEDGIRIMTIHKSKGLEFHTVIVPFCSWKMFKTGELIWCKGSGASPFDDLPLVPIPRSKDAINSVYSEEIKKEYLKVYVDNLNMIYVAFTRASKNLIVISDSNDSNTSNSIAKLKKKNKGLTDEDIKTMILNQDDHLFVDNDKALTTMYDVMLRSMPSSMSFSEDDELNFIFMNEGCGIMPSELKEKSESENVFSNMAETEQVVFHSGVSRAEFRQSNESERFVNGEDMKADGVNYQNEGLLFHEILSNVNTEEDIDKAILRMEFKGCFADAFQRENVKRLVHKSFENPLSKDWFDPHWTVINEQDIIFKDKDGITSIRRPDRIITDDDTTIVIDYKTGHYHPSHEEQVREYMNLLKEMGMKKVKGYLWYIRKESIFEVKP